MAIATVSVLTVGLLVFDRDTDSGPTIAGTPASSSPNAILVATSDRVEVISADDGHVVRTLVETPDDRDVVSVSVTADGETAYYTVGRQCDPIHAIWRVSLSDGRPKRIMKGAGSARVSPNGRYLAYTPVDRSHPGVCVQFDGVVVRDLTTGEEHRLPSDSQLLNSPVAWSPDSTVLIVTRASSVKRLGVSEAGLRELSEIEVFGNGYAFLPTGEPITALPTHSGTRIVTFDSATGAEGRTIAEVSSALSLSGIDATGMSLLLSGPLAGSTDGWDLYRLDVGASENTKLASNVQAATWLPDGSTEGTLSGTTSPPGAAVADRFVPPTVRDGHEEVMPVTLLDGRRLELRYPPDLDVAELGVLPVGGIAWPVRSEPFRCCGSQLRVRYTTIEDVYGDAEPITTYPGADGRRVPYYEGSDAGRATPFDYLVFEFGPWLAEVPNIQAPADFEDRKTDEELATWARSLRGHLDPNGYLVVDPAPPLTQGPLRAELAVIGGPATRGGSAIGLPHVELFSPDAVCGPDSSKDNSLEPFEFETGDDVGAGWCDAEAGVRISVSGPRDFVDRAVSGLEVDAPSS